MKKEEFLAEAERLRERLMKYPAWSLSFEYESFGEFVIGYFHDAKDGYWKVYENRDRGDHGIVLKTKNEEEVYDEVIKWIKWAIRDNEEYYGTREKQKEQRAQEEQQEQKEQKERGDS